MIIEVEDRFCKVAKQFLNVLGRLQRAAASGEAAPFRRDVYATRETQCQEVVVARAAEHAEVYFEEQEPVNPTTEEEILVATTSARRPSNV